MPGTSDHALQVLQTGGIIAYPTEAIFGLGCDPFNRSAVERLCALKQRSSAQGLILISANFSQIEKLIAPDVSFTALNSAQNTWPGPYTWIFPCSSYVPKWISGEHSSVALRVTAHPIAASLCNAFGGPLVSTSANRHAAAPARTASEVQAIFGEEVQLIVDGALGGLVNPCPIRDALSGAVIRY